MVHIYFASLERSPTDGGSGEGGGAGRQDPKLEALQEFLALLRDANAGGRWFLNIHRETIVDSVLAQFSGQAGAGSLDTQTITVHLCLAGSGPEEADEETLGQV